MNIASTFPTTTYTRRQARQIAAIAKGEIDRLNRANLTATPWVREGLELAHDIRSAALGVIDHLDGHEGFETAAGELDALLAEWAEDDPRTFVLVPDLPGAFAFGEAS